jgi:hypothetical protein
MHWSPVIAHVAVALFILAGAFGIWIYWDYLPAWLLIPLVCVWAVVVLLQPAITVAAVKGGGKTDD